MAKQKRMNFFCWVNGVKNMLDQKAYEKGYNPTGADGENRVYEFVREFIGGHPDSHPLGEVVYKIVRYVRLRNPEDLDKAAAWLFLARTHAQSPAPAVDSIPIVATWNGDDWRAEIPLRKRVSNPKLRDKDKRGRK